MAQARSFAGARAMEMTDRAGGRVVSATCEFRWPIHDRAARDRLIATEPTTPAEIEAGLQVLVGALSEVPR
jgi:hypothetical protein